MDQRTTVPDPELDPLTAALYNPDKDEALQKSLRTVKSRWEKRYSSEDRTHLKDALSSKEGTSSLYGKLQDYVDSPKFLATLEANEAVFVSNSDRTNEFAVVDVDEKEWWTVVPRPTEEQVESNSLDGPYVFVEEDDVVEAIGDFVALYMRTVRFLFFYLSSCHSVCC